MGYKVWTYGLTKTGKIGAFLFVAPTPIGGWYALPRGLSDAQKSLARSGIPIETFTPSPTILILLATASLIGAVMLLVGRELVSYEA